MRYLVFLVALATAGKPRSPGAMVFEKIQARSGEWVGRSTKGWTERMSYRLIGAGSCLMETSLDAHPGETMVTIYCMDGDQLFLTHYCVAKNQPRLRATAFAPDLSSVTFTFVDGTNLPTRDTGHMDQVIESFGDAEHFKARWTWYEKGQERWMEEIQYTRLVEEAPKR
jgi:hypothetical protein